MGHGFKGGRRLKRTVHSSPISYGTIGHSFEGGRRLKITICSSALSYGTMGHGFEEGRRYTNLNVVVNRVMGQWDTVLKTGGD
jgi:hypothetical protein